MILRVTMDLFQHRYYRLNRILMTFIGQWPYQSTRSARGYLAFIMFLLIIETVPQILAIVKYRDDWTIVLDSIPPFLLEGVCLTKLIGFMWNSDKTSTLLNRIRTDWQVWARDQEIDILHKYAEQGKTMTIAYTVGIFSTAFIFVAQPAIPKIINDLLKNGTELGTFPFPIDYYVFDAQEYYFYIIMCSSVCVCMAVSILVAGDVILIIYVQHVCGIFAALGHKLERIANDDTSAECSHSLDRTHMAHLSWSIDRHNDAIEYANTIEESHRWIFFFVVGLGTILFNILALQILLRSNTPDVTIRFAFFIFFVMMHLYVVCYISQHLMDHSISVGSCAYKSQWHTLSPKTQKLLQLMTMRCNVPCQLTTGKMLVMSMTTFLLVCRTAISYFMVLRSTQSL